jgi:hypothetical protein
MLPYYVSRVSLPPARPAPDAIDPSLTERKGRPAINERQGEPGLFITRPVRTPQTPPTRSIDDSMAKQQHGMAMALLVVALLLAAAAETASAASCNAGQLAVCAAAITSGAKPSAACCSNLKAQQGCFCQFAKNPTYGRYINSPNARKTVASCGVSLPRC